MAIGRSLGNAPKRLSTGWWPTASPPLACTRKDWGETSPLPKTILRSKFRSTKESKSQSLANHNQNRRGGYPFQPSNQAIHPRKLPGRTGTHACFRATPPQSSEAAFVEGLPESASSGFPAQRTLYGSPRDLSLADPPSSATCFSVPLVTGLPPLEDYQRKNILVCVSDFAEKTP